MNTHTEYLTPNQPQTKQRLRRLGQCLLACLFAAMGLLLVFLTVSPVHADGPINFDPVANWFQLDSAYCIPGDITWGSHMAWGDIDGDGDLDLAINCMDSVNVYTYSRKTRMLQTTPLWKLDQKCRYPAWGDVEGVGDLDLAVQCYDPGPPVVYDRPEVYLNVGGTLQPDVIPWEPVDPGAGPLAWADMDGNGYLDLAVGQVVYTNTGGSYKMTGRGGLVPPTRSEAWSGEIWITMVTLILRWGLQIRGFM